MKYTHFLSLIPFLLTLHSPSVLAQVQKDSPVMGITEDHSFDLAQRQGKLRQGRIMEELDLSEQQTQQLADIRQKYESQLNPLREQIQTYRQQLNQLMTSDVADSEIRSKHQEITQLRSQLVDLHFESMLEMRAVLTPEQRQEFAQLMEQRRENWRQRRSAGPNAPADAPDDFMP